MSRRFLWLSLLAVFLANAYGLHHVVRVDEISRPGQEVFDEHHDLRVLVETLRDENAPAWKWFASDWPLYNGFYRPVPTLTFIADDAMFGDDTNKYKIQNWLIALASSLALFWLVWELFRDRALAVGSGVLFAAWQSGIENAIPIYWIALSLAILVAVYGLAFGRGARLKWLLVAGAVAYLGREYALALQWSDITLQTFDFRTLAWPVGRTATTMTLFALITLAGYCRYERIGCVRSGALSVVALILAFCSYEQAIVVPALLLACGIALKLQKVSVRWILHVLPWSLLGIYLWLHTAHLQIDSRYRMQAARGSAGGTRDILSWLFLSNRDKVFLGQVVDPDIGIAALAMEAYWKAVVDFLANICGLVVAARRWLPAGFGLLCAVGSYSPMAFQHPLGHYFHLPFAMRAIFVVSLSLITWELLRHLSMRRSEQAVTAV